MSDLSGANDPPMTVEWLLNTAHDYYESFYDDPRRIHYAEISNQIGASHLRVLDYVAEALDLGCTDAQNDHPKRDREELIKYIGHPEDDQWNLVDDETEDQEGDR